ncbi:MAG TPA: ATP-binding cassette domain-containing protein [Acidisarcina sp.]
MTDAPFLEASIAHRIGPLSLKAEFTLREPWTVLFGPSGAGKSTLLQILAGLIRPDAGVVRRDGETLMDRAGRVFVAPGQRDIGFLTQVPALFPHLDVRANVGFGLRSGLGRGADKRARAARVDDMLKLFHAEALGSRMPGTLSGGERQRVALARALAPEPRLLLLDEPFAGLDISLKEEIVGDLLGYLRGRSLPVLYVSHDLGEALQTGSGVIKFSDGGITAQGPALEVLAEERRQLLVRLGVPG